MASYNYARYLDEAINSVLSQTFTDWELLVVDDGSGDDSLRRAQSFCDKDARVKLLTHPDGANHGLAATLKLGIQEARGRYVAFLESDDVWTEECLQTRLDRLEETGADVVFNDIRLFGSSVDHTKDASSHEALLESPRRLFSHCEKPFELRKELLIKNVIPTFSCAMAHRSQLLRCDFKSPVQRWLDWWLWLQTAQDAYFIYVEKKTTLWRIHEDSYNKKHSLRSYMHESSSMWRGIQSAKWIKREKLPRPYRWLLRIPFSVRLAVRALDIIKTGGIHGLRQRVKDKFNT